VTALGAANRTIPHDAGDVRALTERLKAQAYGLGFDLVGVTALGEPATREAFDAWLAAGLHGEMGYLDGNGADLRRDARLPHPGATHAIVLAMNYGGAAPSGPIARYARGDDYHDVLRERTRELHAWLERETGRRIDARPYVDSGPVLERDLAQRAGLGWFGKNTMLINPRAGSFLFLASLFVDFPLAVDAPFEADRCGTCTRCMQACPTGAITAQRVLDATRCISYLTIELKGAIPEELRAPMGDRVYGCDICQDVCPYNRKFSSPVTELAFRARSSFDSPSLEAWMGMSVEDWRVFAKGSAIKRTKRRGFLRNVAVALGNAGDPASVPALTGALSDEEPLVRGHAAWALGRIATPAALDALRERAAVELDSSVSGEIAAAVSEAVRSMSPSAK
jgi:epoxyqueuosine reductase